MDNRKITNNINHMQYSNKTGLPDVFVDIVTFSNYSKGKASFSTTEIIGPPRAAILKRRHDDEIVEDVS